MWRAGGVLHIRSEEFDDLSRQDRGRAGLMSLLARWDRLHGPIPGNEIRLGLESLNLDRDALLEWVYFDERAYQRNLIHCTDAYEVLVLCWRSGQRSPIHDHSQSTCGVLVVEGVATETVFLARPGERLIKTRARRIEAWSIIVSRGDDIHQILNMESLGTDLVSLHVYSPPLRRNRYYSIDTTENPVGPHMLTVYHEAIVASRKARSVASPDLDDSQVGG
jgi:cysteine dioxygenase